MSGCRVKSSPPTTEVQPLSAFEPTTEGESSGFLRGSHRILSVECMKLEDARVKLARVKLARVKLARVKLG